MDSSVTRAMIDVFSAARSFEPYTWVNLSGCRGARPGAVNRPY